MHESSLSGQKSKRECSHISQGYFVKTLEELDSFSVCKWLVTYFSQAGLANQTELFSFVFWFLHCANPKLLHLGYIHWQRKFKQKFQRTSVAFSFWKSMQGRKVFLPNIVCLSVLCYFLLVLYRILWLLYRSECCPV